MLCGAFRLRPGVYGMARGCKNLESNILLRDTSKKKRAPSSILHEAKIAYYARNMFEAARLVFS